MPRATLTIVQQAQSQEPRKGLRCRGCTAACRNQTVCKERNRLQQKKWYYQTRIARSKEKLAKANATIEAYDEIISLFQIRRKEADEILGEIFSRLMTQKEQLRLVLVELKNQKESLDQEKQVSQVGSLLVKPQ